MRKRNIAIVAILALVIGGGIYNFTNSNKDAVDTYLTALQKRKPSKAVSQQLVQLLMNTHLTSMLIHQLC
jgi:uncharacterized protein YxeA